MFKDTKNFIILGLLITVGILLLLRQCDGGKCPDTVIANDTIIKWDTIHSSHETVKFKPVYYPQHDTIIELDTIYDGSLCEVERVYVDSFPDSNVTIFTNISTIGIIRSSEVSYRLKVPQTIIKTIETTKTIAKPNKWDLYLNAGVGGNLQTFDFKVGGALRIKNAYYGYDYGLIGKTHNATVGIKIFQSKR